MPLHYFAYGSNLDLEQMEERCPEAELVGPGVLHDYTLAFGGHSPHWEGAPATIFPQEDRHVPGLVYRLPFTELRMLDFYEGHPNRYERRQRSIEHPAGHTRDAHVYVKETNGLYGVPPESYRSVLREAYEELGFEIDILERAVALGRGA